MAVDNDNRIAFIHIPKNAGKSIEDALNLVSTENQRHKHQTSNHVARILFKLGKIFDEPNVRKKGLGTSFINVNLSHLTYLEMQHALKLSEDITKFAVVRNPYTRINSLFTHAGFKANSGKGVLESFSEFVGRFLDIKKIPSDSDAIALRRLQTMYIQGPSGMLHPDIELISFENLKSEFLQFSTKHKLCLKELGWHEKELGVPCGNSGIFSHWTLKDWEFVMRYYETDFSELGYREIPFNELRDLQVDSERLKRCVRRS